MKNTGQVHITEASMMHKIDLAILTLGKHDVMKYIDMTIPESLWMRYHPPSHVMDVRKKKPINLISVGLKNGSITKN